MPIEFEKTKARNIDLKIVFSDVIKGYTVMFNPLKPDNEQLYIKHIGIFDNVETDRIYDSCLSKAKEKELPTEEQQEAYLKKEKIWTEEQSGELARLRNYVSNLRITKSKMFLKSQIDELKKDIEKTDQKILQLEVEKNSLIGFTAEKYASKRANEIYIQRAVFKDNSFNELAMTEEEFNYLTDDELTKFVQAYNKATEHIIIDNLKKISLLPFFCNYFYLCDDNPLTFYGKAVVDLSFFQSELFAYGRYFKGIMENMKMDPPEEIKNDPDKLIEFYETKKNADEVMDKIKEKTDGKSHGATSLVGATKEDLEAIGYGQNQNNSIDLTKAAADKGGQLDMQDFIDLHG